MALPQAAVSFSSHLVQTMVPLRVTVFLSSFFSSARTLAPPAITMIAAPRSMLNALRMVEPPFEWMPPAPTRRRRVVLQFLSALYGCVEWEEREKERTCDTPVTRHRRRHVDPPLTSCGKMSPIRATKRWRNARRGGHEVH